MMTDGYSLLILYSRPGAFAISRAVSFGCESGLRVRKSKMFTDVFVEHPTKGGIIFKEKL
jgi:hypothetical protein